MSEENQVNLFARHEQRLLSTGAPKPQVIPAVVITGFLGSGKTTLVHHILRNRGSLRIAVLVNEVAAADVDSRLLNAKQANAALGLAAVDLSGGCVCCSRAEDLAAALRRLRGAPQAGPEGDAASGEGAAASAEGAAACDYLLVETSGAADAGPLADALVGAGFRLDSVVAVVDAEAGREALRHPVALAQVSGADVVIINKCDLVAPGGPGGGGEGRGGGLGALADLEDELERLAPGVRLLRARFGEVPLVAVLDVEPPEGAANEAGAGGGGLGDQAGCTNGTTTGGGGFMSHESVPWGPRGSGATGGGGHRLASGPRTADGLAVGSSKHSRRRAAAAAATVGAMAPQPAAQTATPTTGATTCEDHHTYDSEGRHHHHHHHRHYVQGPDAGSPAHAQAHAQLHSSFHTESMTVESGPISLLAFAHYVTRHLVREPALLRSKGVLWVSERRFQRLTFHLSGRRRVEAAAEGPWEGPPGSCLVLIGTDAAAVRRLREAFLAEVVRQPLPRLLYGDSGGDGRQGSKVALAAAQAETEAAVSELGEVAARIAALERLELLGCEVWGPVGSATAAAAAAGLEGGTEMAEGTAGSCGGRCGLLVHLTARGSALHGINPEELNAELQRRANAGGRVVLAAVTAPGRVSAVTSLQARDRVLSLLLPCAPGSALEAAVQVGELLGVAEPLLRRAYAHVHNCKCDVAAAASSLI